MWKLYRHRQRAKQAVKYADSMAGKYDWAHVTVNVSPCSFALCYSEALECTHKREKGK